MNGNEAAALAAYGSLAQASAGFLGAFAVMFAAWKGAETAQNWLGQKRAERQVEAAERILSLAYRLEREFPAMRSPAVYLGESRRAEKLIMENEPDLLRNDNGEARRAINSQVYLTRLSDRKEQWDELFECLPIAKAYFGLEVEAALNTFWAQRQKVDIAARMLADGDLDRDFRNKLEGDIWSGWNAALGIEDPIDTAIAKALADLNRHLIPIVRGPDRKKRKPFREKEKPSSATVP